MADHTVKFIETTDNQWYGKCTCGAQSPRLLMKQRVDDWRIGHDQLVERVRSHLGTRTPSLAQQRDYFEAQAASSGCSDKDRDLWEQLAEELTQRLGDRPTEDPGQGELFSLA